MIIDKKDEDGRINLIEQGDLSQQDAAPPAYDANDPAGPIAGPSTSRVPLPPASPPIDGGPPTGPDPNSERSIENVKARIRANPFITPPTNFVSIVEGNNAVKGSWTIDTSLSPPASLLAPLSPGEVRPNLKLDCHNGSIHANVRLLQGDGHPRAFVHASTYNGSVRVAVVSRGKQRVAIKCQSHNGAIKVLLPRDFTGLVGYRTHNGNTLFSPAVQGCTTTFSVTRGIGKCFIGDWQHAEFSPQTAATEQPVDTPRQLSPNGTAGTDNASSFPSFPGTQDPHSHMRRTSATSTHYEASISDPQVRVWSPEPSPYGDYEYAASSAGSSSGVASATPYGTSRSAVSSSTLLPSQSASQIGIGQNLLPVASHAHVPAGIGTPKPRPKSHPATHTPSTISSSTYVQSSNSLLDIASLSWQGDLLEVDTVNGTIRICFVDEPKESKTNIAHGAARLVKSWLAEKGVSADRFVGLTREASGWMKGV